jgi:transcriptional regulator with XRE-family HTH domain
MVNNWNNSQGKKGRGKSKSTLLADPRIGPEIERCREVLRTVLRLFGVSIREVERRTGVSYSYWNNVFSGELGLSLNRLLSLAYALEIEPAELFRLLYPVRPQSPSPGALLLFQAGEKVGAVVECDEVVLRLSSSQAARWARCAEACGYASVEEWLTAAAEAAVLRQRVAGGEEERIDVRAS